MMEVYVNPWFNASSIDFFMWWRGQDWTVTPCHSVIGVLAYKAILALGREGEFGRRVFARSCGQSERWGRKVIDQARREIGLSHPIVPVQDPQMSHQRPDPVPVTSRSCPTDPSSGRGFGGENVPPLSHECPGGVPLASQTCPTDVPACPGDVPVVSQVRPADVPPDPAVAGVLGENASHQRPSPVPAASPTRARAGTRILDPNTLKTPNPTIENVGGAVAPPTPPPALLTNVIRACVFSDAREDAHEGPAQGLLAFGGEGGAPGTGGIRAGDAVMEEEGGGEGASVRFPAELASRPDVSTLKSLWQSVGDAPSRRFFRDAITFWDAYKVEFPSRRVFDVQSYRSFTRALKSGYTLAEICQVPAGVKLSAYHMGDNPQSRAYVDITTILKTDRIQQHLDRLKTVANGPKIAQAAFSHQNATERQGEEPETKSGGVASLKWTVISNDSMTPEERVKYLEEARRKSKEQERRT